MSTKNLRSEIILAYRNVIANRYQLSSLQERYDIPSYIDQKKTDEIRNYFLEYIYPHPDQREELDAAFDSLKNHIKHPQHLLSILKDSASIIFKYGIHLPAILQAGINALRSFTTASAFEKKMVDAANNQQLQSPIAPTDVLALIKTLDRSNIEDFISESMVLFDILHDRKLVNRIVDIINHLIKKMEKKPNIYSIEEVNGLKVGRAVIVEGLKIFDTLNPDEQVLLFDKVVEIEKDAIEQIYAY